MGFTHTIIVKDMEDCVNEAFRLAKPGDTVLLSPRLRKLGYVS